MKVSLAPLTNFTQIASPAATVAELVELEQTPLVPVGTVHVIEVST